MEINYLADLLSQQAYILKLTQLQQKLFSMQAFNFSFADVSCKRQVVVAIACNRDPARQFKTEKRRTPKTWDFSKIGS